MVVAFAVSPADSRPECGGNEFLRREDQRGAASFPASVSIPEYQTSATFQLTATAAGDVALTASAQNRLPALLAFTIAPQFAITGFTPAAGPVGTAVAISGAGFDANLAGNSVRFNGEVAVVVSGSATALNVIVPPRATSGPITVTNFRGTATSASPFTVQKREAFDISLAPATVQVPPGGLGSARIRLASTGLNPYPYAASLAIAGLPAGVTVTLDRAAVALGQDAIATFGAAGGAAGTFGVTVTATGASGVTTQTVTRTLSLQVLAAGGTTVTGRVLHADDGAPFVGARVRLGGAAAFTDESGTYRFVDPPVLGDQVLLIDGNPLNTAQFEYPSGIAMPVMILAGQDNKALTSYIGRVDASRFTAIVPGQAASVTDAEVPNFSLNIQSGQTITGWDGQPVTKINVRKVPVDRLPIRPIPEGVETRSVYLFYFFREGGGDPTSPIPVTMANDIEAAPGEQVTLYYYDESPTPDPASNQWRVMGLGTVSEDGKSIVSNAGVGIPKFCCGAVFTGRSGGGETGAKAGDGCGCSSSNPVDLGSGNALVFRPRPFGLSIISPINPNLQYRSSDPRQGLFGRGMSFSYDWFAEQLSASAVRVTNPQGVQYLLSREADGVYRSRAGRAGAVEMEITPTATGRTLKLADGTRYEFNAPGRLQAITDVAGNRTTFEVDALGFPFSITDATGKVYEFTLSGSGASTRITRIADPAGRYLEFGYDASRRLVSYRDQGGGLTQFAYDGASRINQVTDPRGAVKRIEYDAAGRATREALPEAAEERYAYSAVGATVAETRHTNANGHTTIYRFNGLGYETSMTDALGRLTKTELDPVTNLVKRRIDPAGRVTQYFYNARGDLIRTVDAQGRETKLDYDPRFRKPTRIENALGHVTTLAYDGQGNLTSLTNAELETTTFTYTARGQVETITDPLLRVTRFAYDVQGNLASATNPAGETVTRIYDGANRLAELVDSLNRTTRFAYDSLDRLTEVRDAALGLTRYAYDANDNLLSVTDPNGNPVERNLYDLRNRLKQRTDAKNQTTAYDYDGVGNLVRLTDRKGQATAYAYDALNRLTQVTDPDGRLTAYAYDLAGNLARITDSVSGDLLMSYDAMNRLTEVVSPQGTIQYAYDAIGRRTSRTLSGGEATAYAYDRANRLKSVTLRGRSATYAYDAAGRLTEKVLPNGIRGTYQYDAADRVTSIAYAKTDGTPLETVAYAYDAAGQRSAKTLGGPGLAETPFAATYDEANRLTSLTLGGEVFSLAYDANGNLISKSGPVSGTTTYGWSARNQLTSLSGPAGSASFRYDALGRRIEKTVNGVTSGFLYDGAQAVAELKGNALDTLYHTGLALDEVLARYAPTGNKTLLADALMSVIAQTDDTQAAVNFYAYSAYGEAATLGSDEGNPLQYTGRENDGTGLYYYRARYYDPVLKRFISEDPIGIEGGINLYSYVDNNPLSYTDPFGLQQSRERREPPPGINLPQSTTGEDIRVVIKLPPAGVIIEDPNLIRSIINNAARAVTACFPPPPPPPPQPGCCGPRW